MKWGVTVLFLIVVTAQLTSAADKKTSTAFPEAFVLGRHSFIDIGPPFDFYEILSVRRNSSGTEVKRITVTPPGYACMQPASVETDSASLPVSIAELLGGKSPCSIPEKELARELKRCKDCLVFSGAKITMAVQCGAKTRVIRMDILDRDMFDPAPKTPAHTSWTMALLGRLDQALGAGVLDRPIFAVEAQLTRKQPGDELEDLRSGRFDGLFTQAPDKPSELYLKAQHPPPPPSVTLLKISPVHPISETLPGYPPLARATRTSGLVSFSFDVLANGTVDSFQVTDGHPLLRKAVETAVTKWSFPIEAAGKSIEGTIQFALNCSVEP